MKIFWIIIKYEWLNFRAHKGLLVLTFLTLFAGLYGIYHGTNEIKRQREHLGALKELAAHNV
ncbi:MAG: hypothetical protein M3142_04705, partial [Bacteroidota bacterium]|nr:hypothetical protein [Bacteroidota bacterium]